jgi:hypothetical protein
VISRRKASWRKEFPSTVWWRWTSRRSDEQCDCARAADEDISFTAVVMHAVARVVDEDRIMHIAAAAS